MEGEELTKQGEGWREELSGVGQTYRKEKDEEGGGTREAGGVRREGVGGRMEEKVGRRTLHPCFLRPPLSYPLRSCITPKCLLTAEMAVLWELCCACIGQTTHTRNIFPSFSDMVGYVSVWLDTYPCGWSLICSLLLTPVFQVYVLINGVIYICIGSTYPTKSCLVCRQFALVSVHNFNLTRCVSKMSI